MLRVLLSFLLLAPSAHAAGPGIPDRGLQHLLVGVLRGGRNGNNLRTNWTSRTFYDKALWRVFKSLGYSKPQ